MNSPDFSVAEIEVNYSHRVAPRDRIKVSGASDVYDTCKLFWPSYDHVEYFYVFYLDRQNKILGIHQLSKGGFTGTVVDVRVIYQVALKACACSVIAVHNHPSGSRIPSDADMQVTRKIKEAGKLLEIQFLDHLIITSEGYHSMADEGQI